MSRKTPDERAIPRPGHTSRDEAWQFVAANDGLVKHCVRKYALELTGYGNTDFAGLGPADLFEELIGDAYEGALLAAENLDPSKENFNATAYLRIGIFRQIKRTAEDLLAQRGKGTVSMEEVEVLDGEELSAEEEFLRQQEEVSARLYVEQLLLADLTKAERRLAHSIMKNEKGIPYFSPVFRSLRDKLVKRAAWLQAEGFGIPDGWEQVVIRRIDERAKEWADAG